MQLPSQTEALIQLCCRALSRARRQHHGNPLTGPTLPDVIQEVPALLQYLSPETRAVVSGCNRQLRSFVYSTTTTILLSKESHIATLKGADWPQLDMIVLLDAPQQFRGESEPQSSQQNLHDKFQLAAKLMLPDHSQERRTSRVALFLVKAQQREGEPQCQQLNTDQLHLHQSQVAGLFDFVLARSALQAHIAQLVIPDWQSLSWLSLNKVKLDANAISLLVAGVWPKLHVLDLSVCGLDTHSCHGWAGERAVAGVGVPKLVRQAPTGWSCLVFTSFSNMATA